LLVFTTENWGDGEQVTLGQRIRKRRETLKITQQELAQALGFTAQHISAIEQDKGTPSLSLLPKLAEELGVSTDYLLVWQGMYYHRYHTGNKS